MVLQSANSEKFNDRDELKLKGAQTGKRQVHE